MLRPQEIDDVLDRFRDWLTATSEDLEADDVQSLAERLTGGGWEAPPNGSVGLLQVVEAMTALRHDLKRESKEVRSLREATETALEGLHRAVEQLDALQQDAGRQADEAAERAVRPLVEKLLMLDELIGQAEESVQRAQSAPEGPTADELRRELDARFRGLPRWKRVAAASWHAAVCDVLTEHRPPGASGADGVAEGLRLLRTRASAALADVGVERVACVGRRVDPSAMRVVDVMEAAGRPSETVLEELRPGYTYQGKVVRFAEVRATRGD